MSDYTGILGDSDDSDDDSNSKNLLAASWESLSIMDRLGLKSSVELTEDEVESAFTQFALGFHCDQYTLTQRLQAERHERIVAEENLQRELLQTREMLQVLYERLPELESREVVQEMKTNLQMLESDLDSVVRSAEMLGAAHRDARVSHAVELMSVHLEHLKKRHSTESQEMMEVRKLLHRRRGRLHSDSTDDRNLLRHSSQQPTRRRISITLLPTQSELKNMEASFLQVYKVSESAKKKPDVHVDKRQEVDSPAMSQSDDGDSSVFQSATQEDSMCRHRRNSPNNPKESSREGEESKRGAESNSGLCVPQHRPLLAKRWISMMLLTMLMATLLYIVMAVFLSWS